MNGRQTIRQCRPIAATEHGCHSERSEESRSALRQVGSLTGTKGYAEQRTRARFLAEFTLSALRRFFASLRMTSEGLGMNPNGRASRRLVVFGALALLALSVLSRRPGPYAATSTPQQARAAAPEYLSPVELKFSPDGQRIYVVCEGNGSLLAIDTRTRRVVAQVKVGSKPRGLAISPDGKTLYVSNSWSDTLSEIDARSLEVRRTIKAGWGPVGLTTDRSGKYLYVANSVGNDVSLFDLTTGAEIKRFMTQRYPEQVLLSRDGRRVYVSNILPHFGPYDQPPVSELLVIDAVKQIVEERILIPGAIELRHIAEAPKPLGGYLLVPEIRPKNLGPLIGVAQGWVLTHGMAIVRPTQGAVRETRLRVTQVLLDDIDYYFAGQTGAAFTPDGHYALLTASEANTLTIIDTARLARRLREVPR